MQVQLWHHLKARSLSSQKPLHRLSITCFIHPVSSQALAKKLCEENEGFSTAHGALAMKAGGPQSLTSSLDTKKETETTKRSSRRDPDSTLVSDFQPTAARWVCELQKSSFLRSPSDASSWMQPCSATTRWAKDLLGADAPCWSLDSAPKAYSPETQKRLAASTGMWRLFFSQKEG